MMGSWLQLPFSKLLAGGFGSYIGQFYFPGYVENWKFVAGNL
jgi:hypothetical protein